VKCAAQLGNQNSAGAARKPQPADLFRHAQPWRFARPDDGRKYRVVRERLRRLARILARFDRSGNCRDIFPAVATIRVRLNDAELNYPEGQRFKWSHRTVQVYWARLKRSGIATSAGLSNYHGTKRRVLHSEELLAVPFESCTPTPHESCTRSTAFRSRKLQITQNRREPKNAQTARGNPSGLVDQNERQRRREAKQRRLECEAKGIPRDRNERRLQSELHVGAGPRSGDVTPEVLERIEGMRARYELGPPSRWDRLFPRSRNPQPLHSELATEEYGVCPDCGASVLLWILQDGLHRKVCAGPPFVLTPPT
jgi:hypothetical protein